MDILSGATLLAAGCCTGFLAGFFGVGGGIILVPFLLVFFQSIGTSSLVSTHLAFGTSLCVVVFASAGSSWIYYRNDQIIWRAVAYIGVASIAGALVGSAIAGGLPGKTLQKIFAAVVLIAAIRLIGEPKKRKKDTEPNLAPPGLLLTGVVVGGVSSLAGVGGAVFSIPIMYTLLHFPLKKALGTSSATIVVTAVAATAGYVVRGWGNEFLPPGTLGFVDYLHALPVILGTIPFSRLGATLANKTKTKVLRNVYAVFLLVIAAKMFLF